MSRSSIKVALVGLSGIQITDDKVGIWKCDELKMKRTIAGKLIWKFQFPIFLINNTIDVYDDTFRMSTC